MKKAKGRSARTTRKAGSKTIAKKKAAGKKPKTAKPAGRGARKKSRRPIMRHSREGIRAPGRGGDSTARALKQAYLDRLRREIPTTLRVLRAIPDGATDFQPHEKSRSARNLIHMFTIENGAALLSTKGDLPMPPQFPPAPETLEEAIAAYEKGSRELIAAVESMPDSRLSETVPFFSGPRAMAPMPVLDLLWYMLLDSIHHRGQLSVYIRLAGGKVPSIYGPTADEPWR